MKELATDALIVAIVLALSLAAALMARAAYAQKPEDDTLLLARSCYLEAGFSESDCAAIFGVAQLRAARQGTTWAAVLHAYSAIDSRSARAREIRGYELDGADGMTAKTRERWGKLVLLADAIIRGERPSPCPGSSHWASRSIVGDRERIERAVYAGRLEIVACSEVTKNTFLKSARTQ